MAWLFCHMNGMAILSHDWHGCLVTWMAWICLVPWFSTLTASKPLSQTWPLQILGLYSYGTRLCRTGQAPYAIWLASTKFQVQDTRKLDSMLSLSLSSEFTSKTFFKSGFCNACSLVYAHAVFCQVWTALQTLNQLVSTPAQHGLQWAGHWGQGPDRTDTHTRTHITHPL